MIRAAVFAAGIALGAAPAAARAAETASVRLVTRDAVGITATPPATRLALTKPEKEGAHGLGL